ncbi:hypothetical protein TRFO_02748 [Tritrichomonas foetus]|uniref:Uncharacterized protein n=1 Tax=Tritrichomonas foetus TaxID=1144522 RepID=A0A1J4L3E0_9EUKA|nr:hypothetical protein TRFO_02748 [Tritrichomonas foetus]|eukprot:OHT16470.1 hypothetical protein TRFO_02748 [Tritrichomonas foetus]
MILFLLSIALNSDRNVTVYLGAVSTKSNPFWSQRMPLFHYCDEDNYQKLDVEYSYSERKLIIPFNHSNPNITEKIQYEVCRQEIKKRHITIFENVAKSDSYLRFYVGQSVIKAPFFDKSDKLKIYTSYSIFIDKTKNVSSPECRIIPEGLSELVEGETLSITVAVSLTDSLHSFRKSEISNEEVKYDTKYGQIFDLFTNIPDNTLKMIIIISIGLLCITVSMIFGFVHFKANSNEIPISEIWRMPAGLSNTLMFMILGLLFICIAFYIYMLKRDGDSYGSYVEKIVLPSLIIPITSYSLIARTLGIVPQLPNWMAPCILYYLIFICFPHCYSILFGFFGSFRGFRIRYIAVFDPLFLLMLLLFVRGAGSTSALLNPYCFIDAPTGPTALPRKKVRFSSKVSDLLYIIIESFVLLPISFHLFDIFFDDKQVNGFLFASILILFCSISSIFALLRAFPRTKMVTESWQDGIAPLNFILAIVQVGFLVFITFCERKCFNIQALLMVGVFSLQFFIVILSIGTCIYYVIPFIPFFFAFTQPKSV